MRRFTLVVAVLCVTSMAAGLTPSLEVTCCQEIQAENNVSTPEQCTQNVSALNVSDCDAVLDEWEETREDWLEQNTEQGDPGWFQQTLSVLIFW